MCYCNTKRCKETHTHTHTQSAVKYGWHEVVEFTCSQPTKRRGTNSTTELINIARGSSKSIAILEEEPYKTIENSGKCVSACARVYLCAGVRVFVYWFCLCVPKREESNIVRIYLFGWNWYFCYTVYTFWSRKEEILIDTCTQHERRLFLQSGVSSLVFSFTNTSATNFSRQC